MPYSFHSHSGQFCHHGHGLLEDVVKEAIRKKFRVYGLTEHMPRYAESELYPEEIEANCTPETLKQTFEDFYVEAKRLRDLYKDQISLLIGVEIEYIHHDYCNYVARLKDKVDYVVGSLHHVNTVPIDFSSELYQKALTEVNGNLVDLFVRYFDEQWAMLQAVQPQVVGHFDLIRIFADPSLADQVLLTPTVWERIVRNVDFIIGYGGLFEINSRSWKKKLTDAYPQRDIIKLIKQKGGKFTLSDDCHGPKDVGLFYEKIPQYLIENGIDTVYYLSKEGKDIVVKEHKDVVKDEFWNHLSNW
ncbi:hypothetical protein RMCBS344292_08009 [Rhizopus microsporus]|nr:hypothetical protein RMCBS344292_08009 [Rhizopus microsporus]